MRRLLSLVAALCFTVGAVGTVAATNDKVGICHATNSDTNPYVYIEVSENAAQAHLDGTHPSHHGQTRDDEDYLADDRSDCEQAEQSIEPTPSQSVEPSAAPSLNPSVSVEPSATPENLVPLLPDTAVDSETPWTFFSLVLVLVISFGIAAWQNHETNKDSRTGGRR